MYCCYGLGVVYTASMKTPILFDVGRTNVCEGVLVQGYAGITQFCTYFSSGRALESLKHEAGSFRVKSRRKV